MKPGYMVMLNNGEIYIKSGVQEAGLTVEQGVVDIEKAADSTGVNKITNGGKEETERRM